MPTADLATHPVTTTPYGRWQALNAELGITGFGINAIVCDPGETIDTEHDETDSGQHEAYIVVAGRAEFRVGSDVSEAGPGTIVAVADPAVTRSFRALEPGHPCRLRRRGAAGGCARLRGMDRRGRLVD